MFKKATKTQAKLRLALIGPSGSGKTYTGLVVGTHLASLSGGRLAVIDTERGSASKYADEFDFDVCELTSFAPASYVDAVKQAEEAGYAAVLIDSLTHAWSGKDGALEQVDKAAERSSSRDKFGAWRHVTPMHNRLVDAMLGSACHVVATMRVKTDYVVEKDDRGKSVPRKVGLAPIQRDGMEYEFDVVGDMTPENKLLISKTRCRALREGVIDRPGREFAETLAAWLTDGAPAPVTPADVLAAVARWTGVSPEDARTVARDIKAMHGVPADAKPTPEQCAAMLGWVQKKQAEGVDFTKAFEIPGAKA